MGCDIHLVVERKVGDKWVTVRIPRLIRDSRNDNWVSAPCNRRNYNRFAALAGVRGVGPDPRGIPWDASETARVMIEDWGVDGHSHSWLGLTDAARLFLETEFGNIDDFTKKYPHDAYFDIDEDQKGEYRIVYWFDN